MIDELMVVFISDVISAAFSKVDFGAQSLA